MSSLSGVVPPPFIATRPRLYEAFLFADKKHTEAQQIRKYTSDPYIVHPVEVAELVFTHGQAAGFLPDVLENMVIAALLHDTVEDTDTTYNEIEKLFGMHVRNYVFWLTDVTTKAQGNRRVRKELELERLLAAPSEVKFIKLCDFISNTRSIVEHDVKFAAQYLAEKKAVVAAFMTQTAVNGYAAVDPMMLDRANRSLVESLDKISKP